MVARAIGSGTVSFGLVSIPIKLYTTNKTTTDISFNMMHGACGTKLKQQYVCPSDNEVVSRSGTVKGYEYAKGKYITFNDDELKALEAVSNNAIQLAEFVPAEAIDPVYFDKTYYLGPDKGGERAYRLLGRAMIDTGLVGLAKYSTRGKQYMVLVRPYDEDGLIMHQLRYHEEIKPFAEVPVEATNALGDAEIALAIQIIKQIATDSFAPEKYTDEIKQRVLDLIQRKVDGQDIAAAPEPPKGEIIDLMEALKASLGAMESKPAKAAPLEIVEAGGKRGAK